MLQAKSIAATVIISLLICCSAAVPDRGETQLPGDNTEKVSPDDSQETDEVSEAPCAWVETVENPRWYHKAIGYEIFVRSFADSDGDGIGDFAGLTGRLDYLNDGDPATENDLGVDLLWLMPTSPSPSYHGYDVTDYRGINPDYGTREDFDTFLKAAHDRGIRVVLDYVMNHSSSQHPWFVASTDKTSDKRDWYVWSDTALNWKRPFGGKANSWHQQGTSWYYGIFWSGMPDLNYHSADVRKEMTGTGFFWLDEVGVDGFRLDAVRYLLESGPDGLQDIPETLDFWAEFAQAIYARHPEALLVGEAWASNDIAARYMAAGKGLNMTFNFDLMEAIIAGVQAEDATDIEGVFCRWGNQFPEDAANGTFLTNHDLLRLSSRVKENPAYVRLAPLLLYTLPGTPFVYYGQEIGMVNGPTLDDKHKRTPMQWDDSAHAGFTSGTPWIKVNSNFKTVNVSSQLDDPSSVWTLYRELIALRKSHPALQTGAFLPAAVSSTTTDDLWGFVRWHGDDKIAVAVNLGEASALSVKVALPGDWTGSATRLWPGSAAETSLADGTLSAGDIPPSGLVIFALQ